MANRWGTSGNSGWLYFLVSKITVDGDCIHEIKTLTRRKKVYDQPRQHVKKQTLLPTKAHLIICLPFSSPLQSFPASGSFQMSQFITSGVQSVGVSASTSFLPMNIQNWFPLRLTGWISWQSKRLSRVFSNTTVQNHQFFAAQLSL